jgi:putative transposase
MEIIKAYQFELDPTEAQKHHFAQCCGTARFFYNWGLQQRNELYQVEGKSTSAMAQHKGLCAIKKDQFPWVYQVSKCIPQSALFNLEDAFTKFFKKEAKYPKFKKKGKCRDSFTVDNTVFSLKGRHLKVPKLGQVRVKEIREIEGHSLSLTISREADRWFASITSRLEIEKPMAPTELPVGIDLGLKTLVTVSDGTNKVEYRAPDTTKITKRIKRAQRRLSRRQKGSHNRQKQQLRLARLYRRQKNIRNDFLHKTTTSLARTKSMIVIEDLNAKGMVKNHCLAQAISNAAFGEFKRQLEYKTVWYGSKLVKVSRWFPSSKTCSVCGYVNQDLTLSDRSWICPQCGTHHERDFNAATNILLEGIKINTESSSGIYACGDGSSASDREIRNTARRRNKKKTNTDEISDQGFCNGL